MPLCPAPITVSLICATFVPSINLLKVRGVFGQGRFRRRLQDVVAVFGAFIILQHLSNILIPLTKRRLRLGSLHLRLLDRILRLQQVRRGISRSIRRTTHHSRPRRRPSIGIRDKLARYFHDADRLAGGGGQGGALEGGEIILLRCRAGQHIGFRLLEVAEEGLAGRLRADLAVSEEAAA